MEDALKARVEAFLGEFPSVEKHIKADKIGQRPKVQRIDLDLLDLRGHADSAGYLQGRDGSLHFFIIGKNDEELGEIRPDELHRTPLNIWNPLTWCLAWRHDIVMGETVYEALRNLPDADRVSYILEVEDPLPQFSEIPIAKVRVHKIPSGKKFSEWINQLRENAKSELREELAEIDNV